MQENYTGEGEELDVKETEIVSEGETLGETLGDILEDALGDVDTLEIIEEDPEDDALTLPVAVTLDDIVELALALELELELPLALGVTESAAKPCRTRMRRNIDVAIFFI